MLAPNAALRKAVIASAGLAGATLQLLEEARASMGLPSAQVDPRERKTMNAQTSCVLFTFIAAATMVCAQEADTNPDRHLAPLAIPIGGCIQCEMQFHEIPRTVTTDIDTG